MTRDQIVFTVCLSSFLAFTAYEFGRHIEKQYHERCTCVVAAKNR